MTGGPNSGGWSQSGARSTIHPGRIAYGSRSRTSIGSSGGTVDVRDERVQRPHVRLAVAEQVLVQLLARPQSGVDDLGGAGGLLGQLPGHVGDADRLAHVEDEGLAVAADGGGLDDELHRLLHGHEVAGHLGVGDRDRAARRRSAPGTR